MLAAHSHSVQSVYNTQTRPTSLVQFSYYISTEQHYW